MNFFPTRPRMMKLKNYFNVFHAFSTSYSKSYSINDRFKNKTPHRMSKKLDLAVIFFFHTEKISSMGFSLYNYDNTKSTILK